MKFKGHLRSTFEVRYICLITAEVKYDLNINLLCRYKSINSAKPLPMISGQQFIMYKTLVSKVSSNIGKESLSQSTFWLLLSIYFSPTGGLLLFMSETCESHANQNVRWFMTVFGAHLKVKSPGDL